MLIMTKAFRRNQEALSMIISSHVVNFLVNLFNSSVINKTLQFIVGNSKGKGENVIFHDDPRSYQDISWLQNKISALKLGR